MLQWKNLKNRYGSFFLSASHIKYNIIINYHLLYIGINVLCAIYAHCVVILRVIIFDKVAYYNIFVYCSTVQAFNGVELCLLFIHISIYKNSACPRDLFSNTLYTMEFIIVLI